MTVTIAIGGIQDRADLLHALPEHVEELGADTDGATIIALGDYVDRGPRVVKSWICSCPSRPENRFIHLRGNHDQVILDAIRGRRCDHLAEEVAVTSAFHPNGRAAADSGQQLQPGHRRLCREAVASHRHNKQASLSLPYCRLALPVAAGYEGAVPFLVVKRHGIEEIEMRAGYESVQL
jgi:hypothetical protein